MKKYDKNITELREFGPRKAHGRRNGETTLRIISVVRLSDEEVRTLTRAPGADIDGPILIFFNFFHTSFPEPISNFPQHTTRHTDYIYFIHIQKPTRIANGPVQKLVLDLVIMIHT